MSLQIGEVQELQRRWREREPCKCDGGVVFCPSCLELFRAHARGGWYAVAEELGDPPRGFKRSCCD